MIAKVSLSLALLPISIVVSTLFARWQRHRAYGQQIREVGPVHQQKAGTPTMGGVVILALWAPASLALSGWLEHLPLEASFIIASGLGMGAIGALDDLLSLARHRSLGLRAGQKILLTSAVAALLYVAFRDAMPTLLAVPFSSMRLALPPWAAFLLAWTVFLATTNAVNLTDGLDGLAAGTSAITLLGLLLLSGFPAGGTVVPPLLAVLVGFLWLNGHPARLFLGDVGAFALGGIIGAVALSQGTALFVPLVAAIPVLEALSVIAQVASCRITGKRVFRMSPFHHHLEEAPGRDVDHYLPAANWPEEKVTMRLWIVQVFFVGVAVLAKTAGP